MLCWAALLAPIARPAPRGGSRARAQPTALRTLRTLAPRRFYGTIPNEWAAKRTLPALTIIRLNDNRLSGSLPAWARRGAFPALSQLYLDNNQLEGGRAGGGRGGRG